MNFQDWFENGLKRPLAALIPPGELVLDVGTSHGATVVPGAKTLDERWRAPLLPYRDGTIDTIFAHHFLEHLDGETAVRQLREFERVLKVGGTVNVVVPYYTSQMAAHDLDHKSVWCEETWRNTFANPGYDAKGRNWRLAVNFNLICGVVERNIALFTQLYKTEA